MSARMAAWGAIFLLGLNLRPSLVVISPLLPVIQAQLALSPSQAGLLSGLPVFLLGISGILAGWLSSLNRRPSHTAEPQRLIALAALCLAVSVAIRAVGVAAGGGAVALFLGTVPIGLSIGVAQALIPALIKQMLVADQARVSGILSLAVCLGGALAAATAQPLVNLMAGRWDGVLGIWAIPVLLCLPGWWSLKRADQPGLTAALSTKVSSIFRHPVAWALCLHMALQSMLAQVTVMWLPTLLEARGDSVEHAGFLLSTVLVAQLITALAGGWIASHHRTQGVAVACMYLLGLVGFVGVLSLPGRLGWAGAVLVGLGQGGTFSIGIYMVVLRSADSQVAAQLTGMTQVVGYGLGAAGPWLFGVLRETLGHWQFVIPTFVLVTLVGIVCAWLAGQNRTIGYEAMNC